MAQVTKPIGLIDLGMPATIQTAHAQKAGLGLVNNPLRRGVFDVSTLPIKHLTVKTLAKPIREFDKRLGFFDS